MLRHLGTSMSDRLRDRIGSMFGPRLVLTELCIIDGHRPTEWFMSAPLLVAAADAAASTPHRPTVKGLSQRAAAFPPTTSPRPNRTPRDVA